MPDANQVWINSFGIAMQARDRCGALIARNAHGQRTPQGWEIDHILPVARGGTDALSNLRPLHWQNNAAKGDSIDGYWTWAKTS